jgi:hypothetical protein
VFVAQSGSHQGREILSRTVESRRYTRHGRPVESPTEATVQRAEALIRADRRITIDSVATALGCFHGLAYGIMHDRLTFRKVCARWVPRELKA